MKWTKENDNYLIENYPSGSIKSICKHLDITKSALKNRVHKLSLKRSVPNSGQYQKGAVPLNKGTKGLMKANKTSFKKGHVPANAKHHGKPFLYKRTKANGYVERVWLIHLFAQGLNRSSYTRYLWEQTYGKLPKSTIVTYKNGFIEDRVPVIEDLKIIDMEQNLDNNIGFKECTDKYAKLMLKRSKIINPPKELVKVKQCQIKLNRKINEMLVHG